MSLPLSPAEIEALAGSAGLSMAEVCRRAGLAQSTFTRWKSGKTEPTLDAYRKLIQVVVPSGTTSPQPQGAFPMPDHFARAQPLGVSEHTVPFRYGSAAQDTQPDPLETEAAQIYARINRELAAEEARADRLMRLYNL
jgi:transcriptional regulator with XRE-family HTH domain